MGDTMVRVQRLGKRYRIGVRQRYRTLRDTIAEAAAAPLRWLRRNGRAAGRAGDHIWAIRDVSFQVRRGDVVGVIGRNGAGKSTLLKVLSQITEPTEGEAEICGRVGSLLEVGTGFHPELTGRENVFLNGAILGMRRAEIARKFDEIVDFAEVEKFLDTPVKHYSSGMRMRLAFAVAAHLEPEVLIVDEVLAVGDADFQRKCMGKMEEVQSTGRTVLFVSHNMQAVQRICKRVLLLNRGELVADGSSHEVIRRYMGSGMMVCSERTWRFGDPGNADPRAHLRRAGVTDEAGAPAVVIDIRRPFHVEVEYCTRLTDVRPTAVVQVMNEDGVCLFSTNEFNGPAWRNMPLRPGVVRARCRVPGNLLAEGTFFVLAAVVSYNPDTVYAVERDALAFQVVDRSAGDGVRGESVGDWPGVMRPMLEWTSHRVEAVAPEPAATAEAAVPPAVP
jgi:lipopolysaccharide transport system ATP-binding protein